MAEGEDIRVEEDELEIEVAAEVGEQAKASTDLEVDVESEKGTETEPQMLPFSDAEAVSEIIDKVAAENKGVIPEEHKFEGEVEAEVKGGAEAPI